MEEKLGHVFDSFKQECPPLSLVTHPPILYIRLSNLVILQYTVVIIFYTFQTFLSTNQNSNDEVDVMPRLQAPLHSNTYILKNVIILRQIMWKIFPISIQCLTKATSMSAGDFQKI